MPKSQIKAAANDMVMPVIMKDGELYVAFVKRPLPASSLAARSGKDVWQTMPRVWFDTLDDAPLRRIAPYTDRDGRCNNTAISILYCGDSFDRLSDMLGDDYRSFAMPQSMNVCSLPGLKELLKTAGAAGGDFRYCVRDGLLGYVLDHLDCVRSRLEASHQGSAATDVALMPDGQQEVEASLWLKNKKVRQGLAKRILEKGAVQCADEDIKASADRAAANAVDNAGRVEAAAAAPASLQRFKSPYEANGLHSDLQQAVDLLPLDLVKVRKADCLDAAAGLCREARPIVLNMANAWHAGGGFAHGAGAQEEDLYRRTDVADRVSPGAHNTPLGSESLLVTGVTVLRKGGAGMDPGRFDEGGYEPLVANDRFMIDLVYTAAVDCGGKPLGALQSHNFELEEAYVRVLSCLHAAASAVSDGEKRPLVLSALGCGAFKNPPAQVAALFRLALQRYACYRDKFSSVTFAIVPNQGWVNDPNFEAFSNVFSDVGQKTYPLVNDFPKTNLMHELREHTLCANVRGNTPMFTYSANERQANDFLVLNRLLDQVDDELSRQGNGSKVEDELCRKVDSAFDALSSWAGCSGSMHRFNAGQAKPFTALLRMMRSDWVAFKGRKLGASKPIRCCSARVVGIPTMKEQPSWRPGFLAAPVRAASQSVVDQCFEYAGALAEASGVELHVVVRSQRQNGRWMPDIGGGVAKELDVTSIQDRLSQLLPHDEVATKGAGGPAL